ncbi:MAG: ParB/RepB/Spo0J family partition protein [Myxococcota bacterium]|nr:ParB/RepB/Spo0J family partition protein [Myxococcota bacterium]
MEVDISRIKVGWNPREDFGDVGELARSIEENGLFNPITVKESGEDFELVAGERRLMAHKRLGLSRIDVNIVDFSSALSVEDAKLVENIQRKDLNIFEEGDSFKRYTDKTKCSSEVIAKRIGKNASYVDKRLAIAELDTALREKILKNNLSLGHALALTKIQDKAKRKEVLKDALNCGYNARAMLESNQYSFKSVCDACFDTSDCKKCKHNGSVQSELFETGKTLTGKCMKPKCFMKKLATHRKELKTKYEKQGVKAILTTGDYAKDGELTDGYDEIQDYYGITPAQKRKIKKDPRALVTISLNGKERLYFKGNWRKLLASKKEREEMASHEATQKDKDDKRKAVLKNKLCSHMFEFYKKQVEQKMKAGTKQSKALTLFALQNVFERDFTLGRHVHFSPCLKDYLEMSEKTLDKEIQKTTVEYLQAMDLKDLKHQALSVGTDLKKDFGINRDFLELYTVDGLTKLARELKTDVSNAKKKGDFVATILESDKGGVPKAVMQV